MTEVRRRNLLAHLLKSNEPQQAPRRRPPGACEEDLFLSLCDGCGDCVTACPHDAVFTYVESAIAGTPVMLPDRQPCRMCDGFPCAGACPTGALTPVLSREWKLGTVEILQNQCITFLGPECGACAGLCPTPEPALSLQGTRPSVDANQCIGCGLCIDACPTTPKAIALVPVRVSPPQTAAPRTQEEDP